MASYRTIQSPLPSSKSASDPQPDDSKDSVKSKRKNEFKIVFPFNIPSTPESAAVRIIRNYEHFGWYYTIFVWIILAITLIPQRKVSLIFLVVMENITCLYVLLLKAMPNSAVLHRVIDKRFVLAVIAIVTAVELILTKAAPHLFITLGCGIPVTLVHAVLWIRDDFYVSEEASTAGELVPLVLKNSMSSDLV